LILYAELASFYLFEGVLNAHGRYFFSDFQSASLGSFWHFQRSLFADDLGRLLVLVFYRYPLFFHRVFYFDFDFILMLWVLWIVDDYIIDTTGPLHGGQHQIYFIAFTFNPYLICIFSLKVISELVRVSYG
jgi:hypothetical protein